MVALQNTPDASFGLTGLTIRSNPVNSKITTFDLTFNLRERRGADGSPEGIEGEIRYNTDLFDQDTVQVLARRLAQVLEAVEADPKQPVGQIDLLAPDERRQILEEWNDTARPLPEATLAELFETQAELHRQATAAVCERESLSYQELNERANRLAHLLITRGIGPEDLVAVAMPRSLEMIVSLVGVIKAGAAYLPLDPYYPTQRLELMVEDAAPVCVITMRELAEHLPQSLRRINLDDGETVAELERSGRENPSAGKRTGALSGDNAAYVIYTSGSTGTPKGIVVTQAAIKRLVLDSEYVRISDRDRVGQLANSSFDATTFEVWGGLLNGAEVVVVDRETVLNPARLERKVDSAGITVMFLTTALFNQLAREAAGVLRRLKCVLFGGEGVDPQWPRKVLREG